ncbi:MAG: GTP cyclohydrolase II, partial [Acetobacteraceae bacterium]
FPQWGEPGKIVSLDPFGHMVTELFGAEIAAGLDIRPTIAVTRAHIQMPEIAQALRDGRLTADGDTLTESGSVRVTKIAIEPVWWLPGVAERFGIDHRELRRTLFEHTGGMFPELVTRSDLDVFLPPIGGASVYLFGDPARLGRTTTRIACRVHDECNGSDVFGSDICTCRPYLAHGVEVCVATAQEGGLGIVVYNRKEGRALGEVTKFLVYNARKRQAGGDRAEAYFQRTECVAGIADMRFQQLMPDVLHWLGIARIDRWVSMSHMKHGPIVASGIEVVERVPIPAALIPGDAHIEIAAKTAAGYFTG